MKGKDDRYSIFKCGVQFKGLSIDSILKIFVHRRMDGYEFWDLICTLCKENKTYEELNRIQNVGFKVFQEQFGIF